MLNIFLFCINILLLTVITAANTKYQISIKDHIMPMEELPGYLKELLDSLDYLNLHLKHKDDIYENIVLESIISKSACPLQLSVGSNWQLLSAQRHRAITLYPHELQEVLMRYVIKSGIFLCIFLSEPNNEEIVKAASNIWSISGWHKIYYISNEKSVFYNPFHLNENGQYGSLLNMAEHKIEEIFLNMNQYPLRTYIFDSVYSTMFGDANTEQVTEIHGADAKCAQLLRDYMNFTMNLQWPDDTFFGARLPNGSYDGAIGRMIRNETDLTMTGFFVKDYLTRDFEFTLPVYMDDLCCYVQKAKRIPQSIVPLFAVHIDIWLGFLLVGIVCPPIWMLLRRINLFLNIQIDSKMPVRASFGKPFQYMRIFIDTWVVWVRVNIVRYPPYFSERIFVISLCLVSVIFGALFESSLATVYIKPLRYADINSLEELNEAISKIFIKHAAMKDDLFAGHSSEIYKSLNEKLILVAELEERLIEVMSKRGGFAAVTRSSSLDLVDIRYFQTQKIHKIKECPKQYFISFLLAKHSPYEDVINVNLLKVVQGGFFNYWIGDSKHQAKIKMHKFPDYLEASAGYVWKVLTLNDLQLSFIAWSLGVILSFVSLGIELLLRKKNQLKLFK